MHFVGSGPWFAVLITIHILGAIVGIGPAFSFAIIGPMSQKAPEGAMLTVLRIQRGIERFLLVPVVRYTQWTTGVLLIFNRGLNVGFFAWRHAWLITAIILYITIFTLGETVTGPTLAKMLALAESGAPKAEIGAAGAAAAKVAPIYPLFVITIAVLMIWKPGSGCGILLRC